VNKNYFTTNILVLRFLILLFALSFFGCSEKEKKEIKEQQPVKLANQDLKIPAEESKDTLEVINATFLGNESRNYYGSQSPDSLSLIWQHDLGKGLTIVNAKDGKVEWKGAGWTGQPLMVREKEEYFLIQGAYDHRLKKINAATGELVWEYTFDNVIKGTGTLWRNKKAKNPLNSLVILQGARKNIDKSIYSDGIYSFRAISYFTGEELWRLPIKQGLSYSRDVDASPIVHQDKIYLPAENGYLMIIDPFQLDSISYNSEKYVQPKILQEIPLFDVKDRKLHGGNLVPEASPLLYGDMLYISAGSGHIYGVNTLVDSITWSFDIGADLDGTPAITQDGCLLVPIEKQYIKGMGGLLKLNPNKENDEALEWFFPTKDIGFQSWEGGVIGSVITFEMNEKEYCAFTGLDGYFYVLNTNEIANEKVKSFDGETLCSTPLLYAKKRIGPSISTPLFISPHNIVAAGYSGVRLLKMENEAIHQLDYYEGVFEATPFAFDHKVYVASRNGYLYCFGKEPMEEKKQPEEEILLAENTKTDKAKEVQLDEKVNKIKEGIAEDQSVSKKTIEKEPKETAIVREDYHVIAGAFGEPNNAQRKLEELIAQGFDSKIIKGRKNLDYVVMDSFETKEKAKKLAEKHGLWVYYSP
jgi:outer membrane protein assembly factor BamB